MVPGGHDARRGGRLTVVDVARLLGSAAPDAIALADGSRSLTYAAFAARVSAAADELTATGCRVLGIMADNGIDWVVTDLGAMSAGIVVVPIPPWFTDAQICHLVSSAGVDTVAADALPAARYVALEHVTPLARRIGGLGLLRVRRVDAPAPVLHDGTGKITFTSGSTGAPKGVCLSNDLLLTVANRLTAEFRDVGVTRHLCVSPLATLLENVAGVYVPLLLGVTVNVPSLSTLGLYGSSRIDIARFAATICSCGAESLIIQPELLRGLTAHYEQEDGKRHALRLVAVGGARVADADLDAAIAAGIPACQGYGLSECGSVVALSRPGDARPGSVGRALPGVTITASASGELLVAGQSMLGYLGEPRTPARPLPTGDLGHIDEDGFVYVTGRRKNVFITSFGRNVSPEWPEAELVHEPEIGQACVFGEARPENIAVLVPSRPDVGADALAASIARANRHLPDYARIGRWIVADAPFTPASGLMTATGKLRRTEIERRYLRPAGATPAPGDADGPPHHAAHG